MTYDELYGVIRIKYRFVQRPTNEELKNVVDDIIKLSKIKADLNDDDLAVILNRNIKNREVYAFESVDMTDSINIIYQILAKLQTKTNG